MANSSELPPTASASTRSLRRIESIDVLRGIVIVLMALDHVRDYFSVSHFNPLDPQRTELALYLTRWVTHLCAPIFVLLAGVSIHLQLTQSSRAAVSVFLLKRGLWLVLLEFTVVNILWSFQLGFGSGFLLQIIWAIGVCMIAMAALVHLPVRVVGVLGLLLIGAHNLTDSVSPATYGSLAPLWMALHAGGELGPVYFGYPILPWLGIMAAGYALGALYVQDVERRRRSLWMLGFALLAVFFVVRGINGYGDPKPWAQQDSVLRTAFSFFNVDKYPPSLAYTTITLGIGLLALALLERNFSGCTAKYLCLPTWCISRSRTPWPESSALPPAMASAC